MKHRLEFGHLGRLTVAALTLQSCFVTSCELMLTVDRDSIGRPTSIGGSTSTSGGAPAAGPSSGGTVNAGTGGQASSSTNTGSGGESSSTGGASTLADGCNGEFSNCNCGVEQLQVVGGVDASVANAGSPCDLTLESTPTAPQDQLIVFIDCVPQFPVPHGALNASAASGFSIDYNQSPAHVLLHGTSCDALQMPGTHLADVVVGCQCIF